MPFLFSLLVCRPLWMAISIFCFPWKLIMKCIDGKTRGKRKYSILHSTHARMNSPKMLGICSPFCFLKASARKRIVVTITEPTCSSLLFLSSRALCFPLFQGCRSGPNYNAQFRLFPYDNWCLMHAQLLGWISNQSSIWIESLSLRKSRRVKWKRSSIQQTKGLA